MRKYKLNSKQELLLKEIEEICQAIGLDYWNTDKNKDAFRTIILNNQRNQIISSYIITSYTLLDDIISTQISEYYFGKKYSMIELWKTKKFQIFNYHILENLSLLEKLELINAIKVVPEKYFKQARTLNTIRNGVAHTLFPENLNRSKPIYQKKNVFTKEGFLLFYKDMNELVDFFCKNY